MTTLPAKRHFVPSLLVIRWAEEESSVPSDFLSMVGFFPVFEISPLIHIGHEGTTAGIRIDNSIPSCLFYDGSDEGP
jgi:hypothetical protein